MSAVRDTAVVTVSEPVDGLPRRQQRAPEQRPRSSRAELVRVHPEVMNAVRRVLREGEHVVVVDARTVRTTYR